MKHIFQNKIFLIVFALLSKIVLWFIFFNTSVQDTFVHGVYDYEEIIEPLENLFTRSCYCLFDSKIPYTGRLPGMLLPYYILRFFFNEKQTVFLTGVFGLILSSIAAYLLYLLIRSITRSNFFSYLGYLLFLFIPYFWFWDWIIHPNVYNNAIVIIGLYFLFVFVTKKQIWIHLLIAGFCFTWSFFLRGYTWVYLAGASVFLLWLDISNIDLKKIFVKQLVLFSFFIVAETAWIIRNYVHFKAFIPAQMEYIEPEKEIKFYHLRNLINSWGGDTFWYFENSDLNWFLNEQSNKKFPDYIFFEEFNMDTLISLRKDVLIYFKEPNNILKGKIEAKCQRYVRLLKKNNKMTYYFIAPINRFKNFLFRNPTQDWYPYLPFEKLNILQKFGKLLSVFEYYLVLSGVIGFIILLMMITRKYLLNHFCIFIEILILLTIAQFVFLLPVQHYTYFQSTYSLCICITMYLLQFLIRHLKFKL